jgi:hypothetical protein
MAVSYNGSGDNVTINYLTTSSTNNPAVISSADFTVPTVITSALTVSTNTAGTSVGITPSQTGTTGWNGPWATVVFIKQGSDNLEDVTLAQNTTYAGNVEFGLGNQVGTSGWYCVYNGNSSYLGSGNFNPFPTFTGLLYNTTYQVRACTYNGTAGLEKYSATAGTVFSTPVDPTTALNNTSANKLNIYPTLSRGTIIIEGINALQADIYTVTGQLVKQARNLNDKNILNISELSNGSYFVKVRFVDGIEKTQNILLKK